MPAALLRLVRHGEVHNPDRVLYGRIPGYHLSELGHRMARVAAESLEGHDIRRVVASPLQRAQESAAPWGELYRLDVETDERLIEPHNYFEGTVMRRRLRNPVAWPRLANPWRPSWGEPYASVKTRMFAALEDAWHSVDDGEVVLVSHQMPIVMVARSVAGLGSMHDPRKRRCTLSSITTLRHDGARWVEVDYQEPARELLAASIDLGAV